MIYGICLAAKQRGAPTRAGQDGPGANGDYDCTRDHLLFGVNGLALGCLYNLDGIDVLEEGSEHFIKSVVV